MYTVIRENSGNVMFPPGQLTGIYEFFSGTVVLRRDPLVIYYKVPKQDVEKEAFSVLKDEIKEITKDFKKVEVDLNEPWLVKTFGNVSLEREDLSSIYVTVNFDFRSTTEFVYSLNGAEPVKLKGKALVSAKTVRYREVFGNCDKIVDDESSKIYKNGRIENIKTIFSHNMVEDSNIINLELFDVGIETDNGFNLYFTNEFGEKVNVERFTGVIKQEEDEKI